MDEQLTVLRGCVGAISSATIIKALQKEGVRVVGMDSDPQSVGFKLCDEAYQVPFPTDTYYIDCILDICAKERINAILPSAEEEILPLAYWDHSKFGNWMLEGNGVKLVSPSYSSCLTCADKRQTHRYFEKVGVPMPAIYEPLSVPVRFPCIVKPPMGRGGKGVFVVEDQAELTWRVSRNPELIIQEYIEGARWAVDTLTDWDGTILSMVTRRTLLMQSGTTTKGITERDDEAMEYASRIVKDLVLTGPSIIEYIRGPEGLRFLEINTRFGGGAALSIEADPTIIPNLVKMIAGRPTTPSSGFIEGLTMLRHYSEVFIPRADP